MALGKLFVDLALRDKGFKAGLKKAGGSVKGLEGTVGGLNKAITGGLVKALKVGTVAMAAFGAASAKVGSDFQHSITLVKSLSKDGVENFQALTDEARRLGATTEFSARQSAEAMTNFARAGMSAREIIAATGPALMMAGGAGESMSLATMSMAASLRQFSLDASDSGHVADVFTVALKNSLFNLQGLNDAMKYAGPAGAAFGMSIEETTAAVAQFRNMGLDASMAGTAFRMSMVALAKQTPAMTKVMKKYNIATEDVSVSNIGFANVLNNLADAGVTAEDAIKMFGARAGANMGLLIQQMQKPEIRQGFKDLTTDLYASSQGAGAAKDQYDEMGKTVQRQFLIAKSAIEELLLTTFDTYKTDLMDFLSAIGEVVQHTADVFRGLSVSGSGFNSILKDMTGWLRENKDAVAAYFIDVFTLFQNIASTINTLWPLIKVLGQVLLTAFPTVAVASLAMGLGTLPALFATASAAAASFGVTLNVALGPIGAIIVALTAYATAVYKFDQLINSTEDRVKAYTKSLEKYAARQQGSADRLIKWADDNIKAQRENFEEHAEWMRSLGASEAQIERYRQKLEAMTGETARSAVEAGNMMEVTRDGVTEYHNLETAVQLLGEKGYAPLQAKIDGYKASIESQTKANEVAQARLNKLTGVTDDYSHILEKNGMTQEHLKNVMKANGETLSDWRAKIEAGSGSIKHWTDLLDGAKDGLNKYRLAVIAANDGAPITFGQGAGGGGDGGAAAAEAKRRREARASTLQDLKRMEQDYQTELSKINLEGLDAQNFAYNEQVIKINRTYDDILEGAKDLKIKEQIEEKRAAALKLALQIDLAKRDYEAQVEADAALEKQAADHDQFIADNAELFMHERFDREAQAKLVHLKLLADLELNNVALTDVEKKKLDHNYRQERLNAAIDDLKARLSLEQREATFVEKLNIKKLASAVKIDQTTLANSRASAARLVGLEKKHKSLKDKLDNATTEKQRDRLKKRIKNVEDAYESEVEGNDEKNKRLIKQEERKFKLIEKMRKGAEKTGLAGIGEGAKKALGFIGKVKAAFEDAKKEKPETGWGRFIKGAGKAVKAVKAIGGAFAAMGKKAVGIFSSLSGFSFDLGAMTDEAMGKKGEMGDAAIEAEAARREDAGEEAMTPEEEAAVREQAEGEFDPKAAAEEVAKEQADAMMERLNMALEMIPVFVAKLAENLPPLITAFVEGFPDMIKSLVKALNGPDGLINVIARAVPDLITTIIASLPKLIMPLVMGLVNFISEGIPQIVEALATAIPQIIKKLANAIPLLIEAIVTMIPDVIQSIIEMLPELIDSLIKLVLNLVTSLLEQIPILIVELVNQIPVLITALVEAIPLIIDRVITSLPKIITALINAIPLIIMGVIKAIPKIIAAVINAIPIIMEGLWKGLLALIKAIFVELPPMLGNAIWDGFKAAWKGIKKAFNSIWDALKNVLDKLNPANWFGDTPGAVKVGNQPQTFGFAPNDFVIAAQRPSDLLSQASELLEKRGVPKMSRRDRGSTVSSMSSSPLASLLGDNQQASPADRLAQNIRVEVEGETIDNALITAKGRGSSPQIWNEIERVAGGGATIGLERPDWE